MRIHASIANALIPICLNLTLGLSSCLFAQSQALPNPSLEKGSKEVLEKFQKNFEKTTSFQAQFEQSVYSTAFQTTDSSEGEISVIKPDKFRWESRTEGFLQIISGKKMWYVELKARNGKNVVTFYKDFTKKADPKFLEFLTGKLKIDAHFTWTLLEDQKDRSSFRLTPKKKGEETYVAEIEKSGYSLSALSYETAETKTRVVFKNFKQNPELKASLFEYSITKADIVQKP